MTSARAAVGRLVAVLAALLLVACGGSRPAPAAGGALSAARVAAALEASGLPVAALTAENDPARRLGRPGQYVAKVTWRDTRVLDRPQGGEAAIEIFPDGEAMRRRAEELNAAAGTSPALLQYLSYSQERNAILRVPIDLTAEQANGYRAWFEAL